MMLEPFLQPTSRYDPPAPEPPIETPREQINWSSMADPIPSPQAIPSPPRRIDGINLETGETYYDGHVVNLSLKAIHEIKCIIAATLADEYAAKAEEYRNKFKSLRSNSSLPQLELPLTLGTVQDSKPKRGRKKAT